MYILGFLLKGMSDMCLTRNILLPCVVCTVSRWVDVWIVQCLETTWFSASFEKKVYYSFHAHTYVTTIHMREREREREQMQTNLFDILSQCLWSIHQFDIVQLYIHIYIFTLYMCINDIFVCVQ